MPQAMRAESIQNEVICQGYGEEVGYASILSIVANHRIYGVEQLAIFTPLMP